MTTCFQMIKEDMKIHFRKKYCKPRAIFLLCCISIAICYWVYHISGSPPLFTNRAQEELNYYIETMSEQCSQIGTSSHDIPLKTNKELERHLMRPKCTNLLDNLIRGKWTISDDYDKALEKELDEIHTNFRKKVGISTQPWRSDGRCGYKALTAKISNEWPQTGSFCDPKSVTPCCTDVNDGQCVKKSLQQQCDCPTCVDTSKYRDALLSKWNPEDERCQWKRYSAIEACSVLNKLSNDHATAHFYFVGDSLMRNMFMGLTSILTADLKKGIYKKCVSKELQEICWGENLFVLRPCHDLSVAYSLEELRHNSGILCEGERNFRAEFVGIGQPHQANDLAEFVKKLIHKQNSYIILGVGLHFHCKHKDVISMFLDPILSMIQKSESNWPRLLWVHPNSVGLLKPPAYMSTQGDAAIGAFAEGLAPYLKQQNVPILDFRQITKGVNSYDGTHYGAGVNMLKVQVLLNYLATLV